MKEFKDKVLVVTGGSRGIGKAIAVEGAKRGMKIVLNARLRRVSRSDAQRMSLWIPLLGSFHLPFANIIASLTTIVNIAATL